MYIQPDIQERVQLFFDSEQKHMGNTLGIAFTSFKKDEVKATMPVDERTVQPFGVLHGGASVALAETLASIGAWLNINHEDKTAMGIEINANHIRPVKKGNSVNAVSTPIQRGRNIHVWETNIYTPDDKLVCVSRCTLAIVRGS
ncbi:hotdog fold thioesterase [Fodinibius sp.]|uniref:hotdog fold thioesterase n=1 Tax=Fodinibius sp. TaxID=1872440 RepID=UPI00356A4EF7